MTEQIRKYDENGREIYAKFINGAEQWIKRDSLGNIVHFKHTGYPEYNSPPFEEWREYNDEGKFIYSKNTNGFEEWRKYYQNGKQIHYKHNDGYEAWAQYDQNGKLIHYKNSEGVERHYD